MKTICNSFWLFQGLYPERKKKGLAFFSYGSPSTRERQWWRSDGRWWRWPWWVTTTINDGQWSDDLKTLFLTVESTLVMVKICCWRCLDRWMKKKLMAEMFEDRWRRWTMLLQIKVPNTLLFSLSLSSFHLYLFFARLRAVTSATRVWVWDFGEIGVN